MIVRGSGGNYRKTIGEKLVESLVNSERTVTVVVGSDNLNKELAGDSNGNVDPIKGFAGGVSDSVVYWDPDAVVEAEVRDADGNIVTEQLTAEIKLGHELIHSRNRMNNPGAGRVGEPWGSNEFSEYGGLQTYSERTDKDELRAVGLGGGRYNQQSDFTENQLRRELNKRPRVAYRGRNEWVLK